VVFVILSDALDAQASGITYGKHHVGRPSACGFIPRSIWSTPILAGLPPFPVVRPAATCYIKLEHT
jgi:hypothetical protein